MSSEARLHEILDIYEQALREGDQKTADEMMALFDKESPPADSARSGYKHDDVSGPLAQAASGVYVGWDDELSGALNAVALKAFGDKEPIGSLYEMYRSEADNAKNEYQQRRPMVSSLMQGVGGVAPALLSGGASVPAQAAARAAPSVARALGGRGGSLLDQAATGSLLGGGYGYVAGAGHAQPGERGAGGAEGAAFGATIGAALPPALEAATKLREPGQRLASYVADVVGIRPPAVPGPGPRVAQAPLPSSAVQEKVLSALDRDKMTPMGALDAIKAGQQSGVPTGIADVGGEATRRLGRATATLPGPARGTVNTALDTRADGQAARVAGAVEEGLGAPLAPGQVDAAVAARGKAAAPLYDQVRSHGVVEDPAVLSDLFQKPTVYGPRHDAARRLILSTEGREIAPLYKDGVLARAPTLEDIDLIKRGIDRELYSNKRGVIEPDNALDAMGSAALQQNLRGKGGLLDVADEAAPIYGQARAQFAGDTKVIEAAELGQGVLNMSADEIRATLKGFESAAERDIFRQSSVSAIRQKLLSAADSSERPNLVRSIFGYGKGGKREQLAALFDNGLEFAKFEGKMLHELNTTRTRNFTQGGSNTADKLAEVADLNAPLLDAAEGVTQHGVMREAIEWAGRATFGRAQSALTEKSRADIAHELFNFDKVGRADQFLKALDELSTKRRAAQGRRSAAFLTTEAGASNQ